MELKNNPIFISKKGLDYRLGQLLMVLGIVFFLYQGYLYFFYEPKMLKDFEKNISIVNAKIYSYNKESKESLLLKVVNSEKQLNLFQKYIIQRDKEHTSKRPLPYYRVKIRLSDGSLVAFAFQVETDFSFAYCIIAEYTTNEEPVIPGAPNPIFKSKDIGYWIRDCINDNEKL